MRKIGSRRRLLRSKARSARSLPCLLEHRDSLEAIKPEEPESTFKRRAQNVLLLSSDEETARDGSEIESKTTTESFGRSSAVHREEDSNNAEDRNPSAADIQGEK